MQNSLTTSARTRTRTIKTSLVYCGVLTVYFALSLVSFFSGPVATFERRIPVLFYVTIGIFLFCGLIKYTFERFYLNTYVSLLMVIVNLFCGSYSIMFITSNTGSFGIVTSITIYFMIWGLLICNIISNDKYNGLVFLSVGTCCLPVLIFFTQCGIDEFIVGLVYSVLVCGTVMEHQILEQDNKYSYINLVNDALLVPVNCLYNFLVHLFMSPKTKDL